MLGTVPLPPSRGLMYAAVFRLAAVALALSPAAAAALPQATTGVALLTPANGATVVQSSELATAPTFGWRLDWGDAPAGPVVVVLRIATDAGLTQNASENTFTCTVRDVNCRTSFKPNRLYHGTYYWRVSVAGAARAVSEIRSFTGVRQGGTSGPDRSKPRVQALGGVAQRGQTAFFSVRAGDDRGVVRLRAALLRGDREFVRAAGTYRPVSWSRRQTLYSNGPLRRGLRPGAYRLCVTAWDRAGNAARSCARYRVR
jgi:hypothetical protein